MARYTEEDVQNALADLESGVALATAATGTGSHATLFAAALMVPNLISSLTTVNNGLLLLKKST